MGLCKTGLMPAGLNPACKKLLPRTKGLIMVTSSTTMTLSAAKSKTTWQGLLRTSLTGAYIPFSDYEASVDDPEVQTDGNGKKRQTKRFAPSLIFYADVGMCDYRQMASIANGGTYGFYMLLEDGSIHGWELNGQMRPFSGDLYGFTAGMAPKDAIHQYNRMDVYFNSVDEFDAFKVVETPGWNAALELMDATPTGYDLQVSSFDGDDIVFEAELRCDDPVTGFLIADFELIETSQTGVTLATLVATGNTYTITTSTTVTPGNYLTFRLKKLSSGDTTDISGNVTVSI